ncbi:DUF6241 domain-containing protein [Alkalihalobacillus sp. LMS6]|uniref:DUF6241 domain-containing protein n=1 Tax=Alkalihalobacillus sp. LMS6 TaxID=2924034 RepID=UPI0020D15C64|nr:DUF6241 domain-containing protein [Alkalihalobacillus sp. LMS6]UTR07729.1 DUF6241 domain-containing protein [Alkalihalobacillus sp. LMS6]
MRKGMIILSIFVIIGIVGVAGFYFGQSAQERFSGTDEAGGEEASTSALSEMNGEDDDSDEIVLTASVDEELHDLFPETMSERDMQEAIHFMTHGLVEAEKKWGKVQLTEERIEWLYNLATERESEFTHGDRYVELLSRWNEGDFSHAVEDHNFIWKLWGGTVGEATRLLTPSEVEAYNEEHF